MTALVGAYVCPRGVSGILYRATRGGVEVLRSFDVPARIESERQAMEQLFRALADIGVKRAELALTLRGFGIAHHVFGVPPAKDELLDPIIEREIRRLEPGLDAPTVAWLPLPTDPADAADGLPQRQVLAAGAPRHVVEAMENAIRAAGHKLVHLTALPAAAQRLFEGMVAVRETTALVAPLRDGAFLGFFLSGAMRLVVEPPLAPDELHDAAAMAEETELGAVFVRQQFRGAQVTSVVFAAPPGEYIEAEAVFMERLRIPTKRAATQDLSPGGLMALGGVLDARSAKPLGLGTAQARRVGGAAATVRTASIVSLVAAAAVGAFALLESVRAHDAMTRLRATNTTIEQQSFGMLSMRQTAEQRKLISDAVSALRRAEEDRRHVREAMAAVAGAALPPVRLDSLHMTRAGNGWDSHVAGNVQATTNARSIELIHEFYRELPRRLSIEELQLEELAYADSSAAPGAVRFRMSFFVPYPKDR